MKLIRTLKIDSDDFYNFLEKQLIEEYKESTGKTITADNIVKGLRFKKVGDKQFGSADVLVTNYKRGTNYAVTIRSASDTIQISYTTSKDPKGLTIEFEQIIQSFENKKQNRFFRMFSEGVYLGRMSDTLYDIQKAIDKNNEQ